MKKYRAFQDADDRIRDHVIQLDNHCIRLDDQTQVLRLAWDSLDNRHQTHFDDLTQILRTRLQQASDALLGAEKKKPRKFGLLRKRSSSNALRYSFIFEAIDEAVTNIGSWHARFEAAFFLITRVNDPKLEARLDQQQSGPSRPSSRLKNLRRAVRNQPSQQFLDSKIEYRSHGLIAESSVALATYESQQVLVDTFIPDSQAELDRTSESIAHLANVLRQSDPNFSGLLSCLGVLYRPPEYGNTYAPKFDMLFAIPSGLEKPTSLRALLRQKHNDFSVNERLGIATDLAKSLMFVHNSNFVHKNIRPETIVVFSHEGSRVGKVFLQGFEQFRPANGWTRRKGDNFLDKHIYRHPSRQGLHPETDYAMQHDIYSLGVILLEIGLWTSFVDFDSRGKPYLVSSIAKEDVVADKNDRRRALALKAKLIRIAAHLPAMMGRIYTEVVLTCLNCLEKTEENIFGQEDDFSDKDGVSVAVRFSETVC